MVRKPSTEEIYCTKFNKMGRETYLLFDIDENSHDSSQDEEICEQAVSLKIIFFLKCLF